MYDDMRVLIVSIFTYSYLVISPFLTGHICRI